MQESINETMVCQEKPINNPLIRAISGILDRVKDYKERAKAYYFEVVLSPYQCAECYCQLKMTGQSQCSCSNGHTFDPTLEFQKSSCCNTDLIKKTFHYGCSRCHKTVPSRFLFDERVFDADYFREMMRDSRNRKKRKREEIRRFLAESRSGALSLIDPPDLESIPGLVDDLNNFIQENMYEYPEISFDTKSDFHMNDYRTHILSNLTWDGILFSDIVPYVDDYRCDRAWRFITLIYMQNDREVELSQYGDDLMVQRIYNEADS